MVYVQNAWRISTNAITCSFNVDLSCLVRQEIWMHECIGSVLELERPVSSYSVKDVKGRKCHIYWTFVLPRGHSGITREMTLIVSAARYYFQNRRTVFICVSYNRSILSSRLRAFAFSCARFPALFGVNLRVNFRFASPRLSASGRRSVHGQLWKRTGRSKSCRRLAERKIERRSEKNYFIGRT